MEKEGTAPESRHWIGSQTNVFLRFLAAYYETKEDTRGAEELEKEKWLIPRWIPFNRWLLLPVALLIQFCTGCIYGWSVFNQPVDIWMYGRNRNVAPLVFSISIGFLGLAAATMGPWVERWGPKRSCIAGAACLSTGFFLTALALHMKYMWLLLIGYGVIGGFGTGLSFLCPVSVLQKWFPDRRGLASGFSVCGCGAGAIILTKFQIVLMKAFDLPLTFLILGGCYFLVITTGALVLRNPPPSKNRDNANEVNTKDGRHVSFSNYEGDQPWSDVKKITVTEALLSSDFQLLYIIFMSSVLFGLCSFSRLSNMITDIFGRSPDEAATIVSINGGFNCAARLIFSSISDFAGRKTCFLAMISLQLVMASCFSTVTTAGAYWTFVVLIWLLTSCYAGTLGTISAFLTDLFGASNTATCFGVVFTAWAFGGVAGGLVYSAVFNNFLAQGYTSKDPYVYNVNSWWIVAVIALGWILTWFVTPTEKDLKFRRQVSAIYRNIFCGRARRKNETYDLESVNNKDVIL